MLLKGNVVHIDYNGIKCKERWFGRDMSCRFRTFITYYKTTMYRNGKLVLYYPLEHALSTISTIIQVWISSGVYCLLILFCLPTIFSDWKDIFVLLKILRAKFKIKKKRLYVVYVTLFRWWKQLFQHKYVLHRKHLLIYHVNRKKVQHKMLWKTIGTFRNLFDYSLRGGVNEQYQVSCTFEDPSILSRTLASHHNKTADYHMITQHSWFS